MSMEAADTKSSLIETPTDEFSIKTNARSTCRQLKTKFYLIATGFMLVFTGYNSYITLQSSIHVEHGLGEFQNCFGYLQSAVHKIFQSQNNCSGHDIDSALLFERILFFSLFVPIETKRTFYNFFCKAS